MMNYKKDKKKTEKEKIKEKIDKRKKLEQKWRNNAIKKQKTKIVQKTKKRRKVKHSRSWYRKHLDIIFSKYIRLRDRRCQKCGSVNQLQNSHVIPRSNSALRWDEKNCKALCFKCHIHWWHIDILAAHEWFKNKFPDRAEYLEKHRNDIKSFTLDEYKEMYEYFKLKVKEMENGK